MFAAAVVLEGCAAISNTGTNGNGGKDGGSGGTGGLVLDGGPVDLGHRTPPTCDAAPGGCPGNPCGNSMLDPPGE